MNKQTEIKHYRDTRVNENAQDSLEVTGKRKPHAVLVPGCSEPQRHTSFRYGHGLWQVVDGLHPVIPPWHGIRTLTTWLFPVGGARQHHIASLIHSQVPPHQHGMAKHFFSSVRPFIITTEDGLTYLVTVSTFICCGNERNVIDLISL